MPFQSLKFLFYYSGFKLLATFLKLFSISKYPFKKFKRFSHLNISFKFEMHHKRQPILNWKWSFKQKQITTIKTSKPQVEISKSDLTTSVNDVACHLFTLENRNLVKWKEDTSTYNKYIKFFDLTWHFAKL